MKKRYIVLGLIVALILGWRMYQNNVPQPMVNLIKSLENKENIVNLFNSNGDDITEEYYNFTEPHYKMKNWKSIYNYFQENVTGIDRSKDPDFPKW